MELYPDLFILILTIAVAFILVRMWCDDTNTNRKNDKIEGFELSSLSMESIQNITAVIEQNFMTMPFMIVMFKGGSNMVPDGWALCDGNNGTPNLKDKFIIGAGGRKSLGATGGGSVKLSVNHLPSHAHGVSGITGKDGNHTHKVKTDKDDGGDDDKAFAMGDGNSYNGQRKTYGITKEDGDHSHHFDVTSDKVGKGQAFVVEPVYYALSFIMKLPPTSIGNK
jgi:microcystin-dependent protein